MLMTHRQPQHTLLPYTTLFRSATINRFFQNNLNIAETSRQLHMHRNTLIYRLEQIQKRTGLDLRLFEDAMTFKVATMVINYLHRSEEHTSELQSRFDLVCSLRL